MISVANCAHCAAVSPATGASGCCLLTRRRAFVEVSTAQRLHFPALKWKHVNGIVGKLRLWGPRRIAASHR
jgi:hypothetical protein